MKRLIKILAFYRIIMKKRLHVWIYGLVKGVFFRDETKKMAVKLKLTGFIRNLSEGVEAVFEGNNTELEEMLEFCRKGPKFAKVNKIDVKDENFTGEFKDFRILSF